MKKRAFIRLTEATSGVEIAIDADALTCMVAQEQDGVRIAGHVPPPCETVIYLYPNGIHWAVRETIAQIVGKLQAAAEEIAKH